MITAGGVTSCVYLMRERILPGDDFAIRTEDGNDAFYAQTLSTAPVLSVLSAVGYRRPGSDDI